MPQANDVYNRLENRPDGGGCWPDADDRRQWYAQKDFVVFETTCLDSALKVEKLLQERIRPLCRAEVTLLWTAPGQLGVKPREGAVWRVVITLLQA